MASTLRWHRPLTSLPPLLGFSASSQGPVSGSSVSSAGREMVAPVKGGVYWDVISSLRILLLRGIGVVFLSGVGCFRKPSLGVFLASSPHHGLVQSVASAQNMSTMSEYS